MVEESSELTTQEKFTPQKIVASKQIIMHSQPRYYWQEDSKDPGNQKLPLGSNEYHSPSSMIEDHVSYQENEAI